MEIQQIACVGAGLIGHGWATLFASNGLNVILYDLTEDILEQAIARIESNLTFLQEHNNLRYGDREDSMRRITVTTSLNEAVGQADYVQESVPDNYAVKKKVFKEMDELALEHTILASSASGLIMTKIQNVTLKPERCVLVHPILPVHLIPVVEIVGGKLTSDETVQTTTEFMKSINKIPVVLKREVPGYIVNRIQAAILREVIDLVDKGIANAEDIDTAFCMGIGLRDPLIGPFLRIHLAGGGIERFIENYGQSYSYRWETMETWTSIPTSAMNKVIKAVKEMDVIREKTMDEIVSWRDKKLIHILKSLHSD